LLQSTGGKLELNKCFIFLLTWKWDKAGRPSPQTIEEQKELDTSDIQLQDINGELVALSQKEVDKCHKTLGAYKCLCGREEDHLIALRSKNQEFIRKAWHGQFGRRIARKAYNSNYISSMLYSLVATNVYEKEIDEIQQKSTSTFIRLQGYDMSYPRAVIYGPRKMGGIGVLKLSVKSNCNKVESIISRKCLSAPRK
jgi:hypothetical protein